MTIRLHVDPPPVAGAIAPLPPAAARHAQVRRVQPGDVLLLFDGSGAEWPATVVAMGRSSVTVQVGAAAVAAADAAGGPACAVTLAVGMPANDRMDALVEKATELGVAALQPLVCERSVLRLSGERALRKQAHWQAIAVAACEQSGRSHVPHIAPVLQLADWLQAGRRVDGLALRLQPGPGVPPLHAMVPTACERLSVLSGPEGGLSAAEQAAADAAGFAAASLGPRVLRADTAPLAVLAWIALRG